MNDEIKKIAESVHRWALRHRSKFRNENKDRPDLFCMCGIASWELFKRLKVAGYSPVVVIGLNHVFVKLNGYIVDITSKQFGMKAIEIRPIRKANTNKNDFWRPKHQITSKRGFAKASKWWSRNQIHPDILKDLENYTKIWSPGKLFS